MADVRVIWVLLLVTGCNSSSVSSDAGVVPDGNVMMPTCMPPQPLCSASCGNGFVETCYSPLFPGGNHCSFYPVPEICDGSTPKTCTELGYYGGTLECTDCRLDTSSCDACPPASRCVALAPLTVDRDVIASGPRVAVGSFNAIAIFEGTSEIARTPIAEVQDIAAQPSGWIIVAGDPPMLYALDTNGQLGTPHPLWSDAGVSKIAYAGGRVLFVAAGPATSGDTHLYATITDATGNVVVPEVDLGMVNINGVFDVVTDGTAFFVACGSLLFRIAGDGSYTVATSSAPLGDIGFLVWGGSAGWYGTRIVAQRFDANGALLGSPLSLNLGGSYEDFTGDGDDLLALRSSPGVDVLRISATGSVGTPVHAGAGMPTAAGLTRTGSDVFVAWTAPAHLQVALVTP